jgi:outer membrane protein TolC
MCGVPSDLLLLKAQIGVAEADLYPSLYINGTLGWDALDFSKAFETNSFIGLITPGFRWNILNYGRIKNNVHLQEARVDELVVKYQSKVLSAGREVQVALRGFLRSQEQAEALERSVFSAAEATQVGSVQYSAGIADFNRVFNLETTQVQQQDRLAVAQGDIALNLIGVYRALGGGWELHLNDGVSIATPTTSSDSDINHSKDLRLTDPTSLKETPVGSDQNPLPSFNSDR